MPAVIFDLDGLLADTERLHFQAYQNILRQKGVEVSPEEYAEYWIRLGKGVVEWADDRGVSIDLANIRQEKHQYYLSLLRSSVQPMPGALKLLERLDGHVSIALASSSYGASVHGVVDTLGIRRYFKVIVTRDDVTHGKPFPDIFLRAAELLGMQPGECVVLEDSERGVLAAKRAGMTCLVVPNSWTRQSDFSAAAKVLSSLDEVTLELLKDFVPQLSVKIPT